MDELLRSVQGKVEAGEVLTEAELKVLDEAARRSSGPQLTVALAQAWLNADAAEPALRVLEGLGRDHARDPRVQLALSRALMQLERWQAAERVFTQMVAEREDPEALKGLAVLAMRRGELERARALVQRALEADPLDSEAQMLHGEVQGRVEPETRDDFVQALVERLAVQSTPHLLQNRELVVRLGQGGVARLDLDSLYTEHRRSGRPLQLTVEALAKDLAERALDLPEGHRGLLATLLPVLRDDRFLERGVGSVRREGPAGLWVFYVLEDPDLVRYVPLRALDTHQVTLEALDEVAWKNLDASPAPVRNIALEAGQLKLSTAPTGLWALAAADGHDAARLLTPAQQRLIHQAAGPQPLRVYLGLRELVLFCRDDAEASREQLQGLQATRDGIAGAYRLESGRLLALPEWT